MRTVLTLSVAALCASVLLTGSCQKHLQENENGETLTFQCVFAADADSRVSVSDAGKTKWEAGDEIMIHGGGLAV